MTPSPRKPKAVNKSSHTLREYGTPQIVQQAAAQLPVNPDAPLSAFAMRQPAVTPSQEETKQVPILPQAAAKWASPELRVLLRGRAHQLFGDHLPKLLDELNEVLAT